MVDIDSSLVEKLKNGENLNEIDRGYVLRLLSDTSDPKVDKVINADTYNKYKGFLKEDGCKSNLAKFIYREFVSLGIEQNL